MYKLQKRTAPPKHYFRHVAELDNNNSAYIFIIDLHQEIVKLTSSVTLIEIVEETNARPIASMSSNHNSIGIISTVLCTSQQLLFTNDERNEIAKAKAANTH